MEAPCCSITFLNTFMAVSEPPCSVAESTCTGRHTLGSITYPAMPTAMSGYEMHSMWVMPRT